MSTHLIYTHQVGLTGDDSTDEKWEAVTFQASLPVDAMLTKAAWARALEDVRLELVGALNAGRVRIPDECRAACERLARGPGRRS